MAETTRRALVDGLKPAIPSADPKAEEAFVFGTTKPIKAEPQTPPLAPRNVAPHRVQFSSRLREDYANALKRTSLQRQLDRLEPSALQDILEEAIGTWLQTHGCLLEPA